jgi:DNA polymerase I-like protein with 3'-5' exonuclease and polymerase domains/5'-3' exonuclease
MKRFVLVDGNALLHRAYHATPPLTTSKGELVNAVFGFTNMILKAWDDLKPDFIAIAWDKRAPTFRHQAYTQYKATRGPMDESLGNQYDRVHEVIKTLGIPEFGLDGYEADDLIGTLARQAKQSGGIETIVLTGDRDIMQIIDDSTRVLMPKKTLSDVGLYGEKEFEEKYSFKPIQIIDFKGLSGDASDNIPGVPGIGAVTATKLIKQFGSVEKIYEPKNLQTLPQRTQLLLSEGAESAIMSKKLATLDLNAPIELDLVACRVSDYNRDEVIKVFEELEFKTLVTKLTGKGKDPLAGENQLGVQVDGTAVKVEQNKHTTDLDSEVNKVLKKMIATGVLIDLKFLEKMGTELKTRLKQIEEEIFKSVGHEFNLNSPKQLSEVLFDELHLPVIRKTKTGRSTDEETLNELAAAHPMIPLFLEYRQLFKLVSTYIDALPKSVGEDGRIHSTFNVEGAATGRLSSTNPNLQNIPIRGQMGGEIRKAFIASPGKVLLGADYSQVELRILAHVSEDENLIKAFKEGLDIHTATAAKIFNLPIEEVSKDQRVVGKTMNFATLYGQGPRALSKQLKIDAATAKNYIDEYFAQFPKVKNWMFKILEQGRKDGFVETIWGRRRYIPELNMQNKMLQSFGERAAINHPIQGTSADMIKKAMIEIDKVTEKNNERSNLQPITCNLILQVHDELLFECDPKEIEATAKLIKEKMESSIDLKVPVKVDLKTGLSWGEMSLLNL